MRYAIVQATLDIPPVDALRRAFRNVPFLTDLDAVNLARDAFGILVKNLSRQQAVKLQGVLRHEGVQNDIVDQSRLPTLPPGKLVHRVDCLERALMIYDPLGRCFPVEWRHVMLVAAGQVTVREFERVRKLGPVRTRYNMFGHPVSQEREVRYATRERQLDRCLLEIVLTGGVLRYSAQARKFNFSYLQERKTRDPLENYRCLVRDLLRHAPGAALNRGAWYVRESSGPLFAYPSKNAFFEEVIWLLWRWDQAEGRST